MKTVSWAPAEHNAAKVRIYETNWWVAVEMKTSLVTITVLVLALGWNSEAVEVEVSASRSRSVFQAVLWPVHSLTGVSVFIYISCKSVQQNNKRLFSSLRCDFVTCCKISKTLFSVFPTNPSLFYRKMDWFSPWRPLRDSRSWLRAGGWWDNKAPDSGPTPCLCVPTQCCPRSFCHSVSKEEQPPLCPDLVRITNSTPIKRKGIKECMVSGSNLSLFCFHFISAMVPLDVCEICAFAACTGC